MKKKILILALFGMMCGTRVFAQCTQNLCSPYIELEFQSGPGIVCVQNTCSGSDSGGCYNIPAGGGYVCCTGMTNPAWNTTIGCNVCVGSAWNSMVCAEASNIWNAEGPVSICGLQISVANSTGVITDYFNAYWNPSTCTWTIYPAWPEGEGPGNWYTLAGYHHTDFVLTPQSDGSILISLGYPDGIDDEGNVMTI